MTIRKIIVLLIPFVFLVSSAEGRTPDFREWQNAEINQINRLPAHTDLEILWGGVGDSNYSMSINGTWKFNWVADADDRPADFYTTTFDDSSWGTMPVPGNWELHGFGDPVYINIGYAWRGHYENAPPIVPVQNNHVGSYRKSFIIPDNWHGRQIRLHIGSATSNIYIWVNGKFAGYSEDSKMEAEFDVTPFIKKGENLFAFQIFRWCDGTYLEDQDYIRLTGIGRDCFLYAIPKTHISDINITTPLDEDYSCGTVNAEVYTSCSSKGWMVECSLSDACGNHVGTSECLVGKDGKAALSVPVPSANLWSAESPYLYKALFSLKDKNGNRIHEISKNVGLREVVIENGQLKVNGKAILVKGVNRHETDPDFGHYISYSKALQDARIMKENNINAVRTCHYPDADSWYDICDQVGLYVVAEANVESHGMGYKSTTLAANPVYAGAHLERNISNVIRNRNHPSVIIWSLGNEAGDGPNFDACYDWIKANDPTRPVQYERALGGRNTDIFCPMYATYVKCRKYLESNPEKPLIQCEYAHAMGNSEGGLKEYWDLVRKYPMYQGGFIWDFVDQAVRKVGKSGRKVLGYGGDWNTYDPTDHNFCANGLIHPERRLNPHIHEVRYCYQSIWTELSDGKLVIRNENSFVNLDNVLMKWTLLRDGKPVKQGYEDLYGIPAETEKEIELPVDVSSLSDQHENIVNLSFVLKSAETLLDAGHEVAKAEHIITPYTFKRAQCQSGQPLEITENGSLLLITDGTTTIGFDKDNGFICCYRNHHQNFLAEGSTLRPNFWRAVTDNDFGAKLHQKYSQWRNPEMNMTSFVSDAGEDKVTISACYDMLSVKSQLTIDYCIYAGGIVHISMNMTPVSDGVSEMFRFGMRFEMPEGYENLTFYGRGPHENYPDRSSSALLGIYDQSVTEQFYPYVRPQETGTHSDIRWISITTAAEYGIRITSDHPFYANALHYSVEMLDEGEAKHNTHPEELDASPLTWVCIDSRHMGLGCENSWGRLPLEQYRIPHGKLSFNFTMQPVGMN